MAEGSVEVVIYTREQVSIAIAQQVVDVVNAAYILHRNIFPHERTTPEGLNEALIENDLVLVRATPERTILGSGLIHRQEQSLHLGMLAIDPRQQGKGLGTRLVQEVEQIARQRQLTGIVLTAVRNIGNVEYYLHLGFHIVKEEHLPVGTWQSIRPFDMAYMEKRIDGHSNQH